VLPELRRRGYRVGSLAEVMAEATLGSDKGG